MLTQILQGGADKAAEASISIVGGHSIDDREPKYGLVVTGEVDKDDLITNEQAQIGDVIILTKPLGTGMLSTAIKKGKTDKFAMELAVKSMSELNRFAADCMQKGWRACRNRHNRFGLLGHLLELCQASQVSAQLEFSKLPFLPTVFE